jgi:3-methyladenine DNA glycosylase AlkC
MLEIMGGDKNFSSYFISRDTSSPLSKEQISVNRPMTTTNYNSTFSSNMFSVRSTTNKSTYKNAMRSGVNDPEMKSYIISRLSSSRSKNSIPNSRRLKKLEETKSRMNSTEENFTNLMKDLKEKKLSSPKKKQIENSSQFLFIDHSRFKPIEITNEKVRKLHSEVKFGPYYSNCPSCNNRNLDFYDKLRPDTAVDLLQYIRKMKINN